MHLCLQQSLEETFGGFAVTPFLNQNIEHNSILVHRAPQIMKFAPDADEDLIQVPLVARSGTPPTQTVRETLAELLAPATDRFVRDEHASLRQDEFDVPQAQTEDVVQPDGMADDLNWKAVTILVGREMFSFCYFGLHSHGAPVPINVTMPARRPYRLDRGQRTTGMAKGDRLWPPLARGNHDRSIQTDYWPATSGTVLCRSTDRSRHRPASRF